NVLRKAGPLGPAFSFPDGGTNRRHPVSQICARHPAAAHSGRHAMTAKAFSAVLATAVLLASGHALAQATTLETDIGEVLVGEGEMTLYTFRNDEAGVSNCYDDCAVNWPPFLAEEGATAEEPYSL